MIFCTYLRQVDGDRMMTHPEFRQKLEAVGFGVFIPIFSWQAAYGSTWLRFSRALRLLCASLYSSRRSYSSEAYPLFSSVHSLAVIVLLLRSHSCVAVRSG